MSAGALICCCVNAFLCAASESSHLSAGVPARSAPLPPSRADRSQRRSASTPIGYSCGPAREGDGGRGGVPGYFIGPSPPDGDPAAAHASRAPYGLVTDLVGDRANTRLQISFARSCGRCTSQYVMVWRDASLARGCTQQAQAIGWGSGDGSALE